MVLIIRETVRSEIAMPSIFSSPWMRALRIHGIDQVSRFALALIVAG